MTSARRWRCQVEVDILDRLLKIDAPGKCVAHLVSRGGLRRGGLQRRSRCGNAADTRSRCTRRSLTKGTTAL